MDHLRKYKLLFGFLLICFASPAQIDFREDSLVNIINTTSDDRTKLEVMKTLISAYANVNKDSMGIWIDRAYPLVEQPDASQDQAWLFYMDGERYIKSALYDQALEKFDQCITYSINGDHRRELALGNGGKALVYIYTGLPDSASFYSLLALKEFETLKDTMPQIQSLFKLVHIQSNLKNLEQSKAHLDRAKKLVFESKRKDFYGTTYLNYGILHYSYASKYEGKDDSKYKSSLDSALVYYQKAYDIYKSDNMDTYMASALFNMGLIYKEQLKWEKALNAFSQAYDLALIFNNPSMLASARTDIADCRVNLGQPQEAIKVLLENETYFSEIGQDQQLLNVYNVLSEAYASTNDYKKAHLYKNKQLNLQIDILNEKTINTVNDLDKKYETDKKKEEIDRLSLEHQLDQIQLSNQRIALISSLIGLVFLAGVLCLFLYQNKKIKRQNKLIKKTLKEKDILLREIHHRVKNNLQLISSLLSLQSHHLKDQGALTALNSSKSRVKSMVLIHQELYQKEELTGVGAKEYIEKLCDEIMTSYLVNSSSITWQTDIDDLLIDVDTLVPLGLIINELLTNVMKYAFPHKQHGHVTLQLKEEAGTLLLFVKDDGIGLNKAKKNEGSFGFKLIQTLTEQLEGTMNITSVNGTTISFRFEDYKIVA